MSPRPEGTTFRERSLVSPPPRRSLALALLVAVTVAAATGLQAAEALPEAIVWLDLGQGIAAMEEGDRAALIFFTASWCPHCREMSRTTFRDPRVVASLHRMVTIRLDVDRAVGEVQAHDYGVTGVPALVIVHGDHEKVLNGYVTADELLAQLGAPAKQTEVDMGGARDVKP